MRRYTPTAGQAVAAALLLSVLMPELNEASEIRVRPVDRSPTLRDQHHQDGVSPGPHLEYTVPPAPIDTRIEVPPAHIKMTVGTITMRVERAVPEQLELFSA